MPIFAYKCTDQECNQEYDYFQRKIGRPPASLKCPICKGKMVKQISAPAIQFKGSGWTSGAGRG